MKKIYFYLVLFVMLLYNPIVSANMTLQDLLYVPSGEVINANVRIVSREALASGVVIKVTEDKTYILTVAHGVVRPITNTNNSISYTLNSNLRVYTQEFVPFTSTSNKFRANLEIIKYDAKQDLALVVADKKFDIIPIKISKELPKQGDKVWHIGNPNKLNFLLFEGIVSAIKKNSILASLGSYFGGSGGMVLNTKGEIIGIVVTVRLARIDGRYPTITSLNDVTRTDNLNKFLEDIEELK